MKIHLRQIPDEGLHLEGEEDCPIGDIQNEEITCAGPLRYSIDVGISEGALWANGHLAQPVELTCVSCLRRFVHTVEVPAFAVHTELGGPELIDLTPQMREDILLNLPAYPHCDRHGGLVCPGAKVTAAPDDAAEAEKKRKAAWGALDKLDL
ncbi:MAG: YceD family protein [Chthoniobacterales bacterium]